MVDASAKLLLIAELVALEDRLDVNVEKAPKYYARHKTWDPPPVKNPKIQDRQREKMTS